MDDMGGGAFWGGGLAAAAPPSLLLILLFRGEPINNYWSVCEAKKAGKKQVGWIRLNDLFLFF